MTRDQFHNGIRVLFNLDAPDLAEVGIVDEQALRFISNPIDFFIRCDDATCNALWSLVARRVKGAQP